MKIGSLCSGYGGLDQGVQLALGGETVWVSDIDKGANKILAHRSADVPNLGDFTTVDWAAVTPIEVLTAGFPCQPVSHAGKRLGDEDERWLWDDVARAVRDLRPSLVVLENVRGLLTAGAGRLFGRVVGALADLGYDAQWHGLRAADIGAPHGRWRVFIVAEDTHQPTGRERWVAAPGQEEVGGAWPDAGGRGGAPASEGTAAEVREHINPVVGRGVTLLPTPTDVTKGGGKSRSGARSGEALLNGIDRLLPTPRSNADRTGRSAATRRDSMSAPSLGQAIEIAGGVLPHEFESWDELPPSWQPDADDARWGDYAAAIARWEHTIGRPAPDPTITSAKGNPQLSPRFVEWMMGLPEGHVTDVPGITRNEALKALGNGVVPQQAAAALRIMLATEAAA